MGITARLRQSFAPRRTSGIDPTALEQYLRELPGVVRVHDLHIWAMSTTESALTAHLVKPDGKLDDPLLLRIQDELHDQSGTSI